MSRIRSKDTSPEMIVRKIVHGMGYRYRLHRKDLPGKPDLVFPSRKKVIFIHGCFWHQHHDSACKISRMPKSKKEYWESKLQRNAERDRLHESELKAVGWEELIIWECELDREQELINKILEFMC